MAAVAPAHNALARRSVVAAGACAQVAGLVWIAQWAHALVAHGPTSYDRKLLWLGMTWFDSGKFLALPFLLLVPAVVVVVRRGGGGRGLRALGAVTSVLLVLSAVATALQFWPHEWGVYASEFPVVAWWGGPIQAVTSAILLPLALLAFGVAAVRARAMPAWIVPVLVVGSLSTVFLAGPLPPVPGLAWLLLGGWLLTTVPTGRAHSGEARREDPPA